MDKYPALRTATGILTLFGWLVVGASVISALIGVSQILVGQLSPNVYRDSPAYGTFLVTGAVFFTLFGLFAVVGAGAVNVLIDIERDMAPVPVEQEKP